MSGGSKKQTVGYWYSMGLHMGICHGPVDSVMEIRAGDRTAWSGNVTASGQISINAESLFGGKEKEGGIVGTVDVMMGESTQGTNSYLASKQSGPQPAYRGFLGLVFRGGKIAANNPYIKPWAVRVKRILQGWDGGSAWYPEKAEIIVSPGQVFVEDLAFPATSASIGGLPAIELNSGFTERDIIVIEKPVGLTYKAWSNWNSNALGPDGKSWHNLFRVTDGEGNNTDYWPGYYLTAEEAEASRVGQYVLLQGSDYYKISLVDTPVADNRGGMSLKIYKNGVVGMNPAHIIYECLTNREWGLGYPAGKLDLASFTAAADTFYAEGMGLCIQWTQQDAIQNFIQMVVDHAGAALGEDPRTGLFKLKAIRADYTIGSLPEYSAAAGNIISLDDFDRASLTETINEIAVSFVDASTGQEGSVTVQQLANIQAQGAVVPQGRNYPGLPALELAVRIALRDLKAAASALARVRLTATRAAWALSPGDVIRFAWPELGIAAMALRVVRIDYGSLTDGAIRLECVEDVFGLPASSYIDGQPIGWEEPDGTPTAATAYEAFEVPFRELVQTIGQDDAEALAVDAGYVATVALRPSGIPLNYELRTKVGAAAYAQVGNGDWCPSATLLSAIAPTTTSLTLTGVVDLDDFEVGKAIMVGTEICRVDTIDLGTSTITVGRGCCDTVPASWASGTRVWAYDEYAAADGTQYTDGETVDTKILTRSSSGILEESVAPVDSVTLDSRAARPYPPGLLRLNTAAYPATITGPLTVSWAHRDRLLQADQLIDENDASIGPEPSTTYTLRLYGQDGLLKRTEIGLTGTSYAWSTESVDSGLTGFSALLHGDGTNGSTTILDDTGKVWTASGNAQISTARLKFGTGSILFDGNGDYCSTPASADFNFGTGDWYVRGWVWIAGNSVQSADANNRNALIFAVDNGTTTIPFEFGIGGNSTTTGTALYVYDGTTVRQALSTITQGAWHYCEASKVGTSLRFFLDGTQIGSTFTVSGSFGSGSLPAKIGGRPWSSNYYYWLNGNIEELEIRKTGGNTANYTPPTAPTSLAGGGLNSSVRVRLKAVRSGLDSWTEHDYTVTRV